MLLLLPVAPIATYFVTTKDEGKNLLEQIPNGGLLCHNMFYLGICFATLLPYQKLLQTHIFLFCFVCFFVFVRPARREEH